MANSLVLVTSIQVYNAVGVFSILRFVAFNLVLNAFNSRFSSRSILVTQDDIYQHVRIMTQSHLSAYEIRKAIIAFKIALAFTAAFKILI